MGVCCSILFCPRLQVDWATLILTSPRMRTRAYTFRKLTLTPLACSSFAKKSKRLLAVYGENRVALTRIRCSVSGLDSPIHTAAPAIYICFLITIQRACANRAHDVISRASFLPAFLYIVELFRAQWPYISLFQLSKPTFVNLSEHPSL